MISERPQDAAISTAFSSLMSIWPLPSVSNKLKASRTSSISSSLKPARFLGLRPPANALAPDSAPKRARPDMASFELSSSGSRGLMFKTFKRDQAAAKRGPWQARGGWTGAPALFLTC